LQRGFQGIDRPTTVEMNLDPIYYDQLARVARRKASVCGDRDLALRLREAAIKHERTARKLRRHGRIDQGPASR
jgi:hypothetical protein